MKSEQAHRERTREVIDAIVGKQLVHVAGGTE